MPAVELLEGNGLTAAAQRIRRAIDNVLAEGKARTPDLGGASTTTQMTEAIVEQLANVS